jgi:antirestriction protein ArdC
VLREDNRAIVRAASQASKAAEWLLSFLSEPFASTSVDIAGGDQKAA